MHYCGQCGAQLEPQALASGRCSACGTAVTSSGDILVPVHQHDSQAASAGGTTVPDASLSGVALPAAAAQWPWEPSKGETPAPRAATRTMVIAGVCLILCAVLLLCADAVLVISAL
jgi:hypothetical protein